MDRPLKSQIAVDKAAAWLLEFMILGKEYMAGEILSEAILQGHKERTLRRAASRVGVSTVPVRDGSYIAYWTWTRK